MDRLDAMNVFVQVATLRGFAPAARKLGLSAPMVTRLISSLETRLGVRLLQRTTRSVSLTDAGSRFLERVRRIVADIAEAEDDAHAQRTAPSGRFVVTAPNVFGRLHVAPFLSRFLSTWPDVVGELTLSDRTVNLVEDGVDVAVRIGALDDSSNFARKVGETRRVVVASPDYLATHPKLRSPDDLARHRVIQFTGVAQSAEWRLSKRGRVLKVPLAPAFITNSADAAITHAENGGGLTMVLAYQVVERVRAGHLEVVLPRFAPPPLPIHVVFPSTRQLSANVRAFIDLLVKTCDWQFTAF